MFPNARLVFVIHFLLVVMMSLAWEPTWESLDSRPLPSWYDEAKFGIFLHWGVFSVPAFGEWFWAYWKRPELGKPQFAAYINATEAPRFAYQDYAQRFDASLYNPQEWAQLFADAGAQYVVLTSKHQEGFCNWDSRDIPTTWNWNAMDVGPRRDILGELANAIKSSVSPTTGHKLRWGVYHNLMEFFNPAYLADADNGFKTTTYADTKSMPELYDLVKKYEPELIWSDGGWDAPYTYWKSTEFLAWYATNSSVADTAVWNDRWGRDMICKHGGYHTCQDKYQPGKLVVDKWENALTMDNSSWGLNRNASYDAYFTTEHLIHELIETVAFGGNMLLNIGPNHDGTIGPMFWDRLLGIGSWLKVNGEAIYATKPWMVCQNETTATSSAYYTHRDETLYALVTRWPRHNILSLQAPQPTADTKVHMIGVDHHTGESLEWTPSSSTNNGDTGITIQVPALTPDIIPCQHAWVFAITGLANL